MQVVQRQHQRAILADSRQQLADGANEPMTVEVLDTECVQLRLQRIGDHSQREIGLELRGPAGQREEAARLGAVELLADQRGLADAGLAGEVDGTALATGEPLERQVKRC
ncbi:MAG: hypothetical protein E6G53_10345 [Actinobacteria bacterium]|nr:MAG: hypothetical protein E6G53_10345 [Actinomycetota bacterium]